MNDKEHKQAFAIINAYPALPKAALLKIRNWIFEQAKLDQLTDIEETLKWGEPSYLLEGGSTIRIDYKEKHPNKVAIYFNCQTKLVETIREVYRSDFEFEGNRAVLIDLNSPLPEAAIKHCLSMALNYHKIKHLPLLGA